MEVRILKDVYIYDEKANKYFCYLNWSLCGAMALLAIIQLMFSTMDPFDSKYIIYE